MSADLPLLRPRRCRCPGCSVPCSGAVQDPECRSAECRPTVVRFKVVPFQFIFVIVRVCVFCCLKACQHQLCTTVASVVPPRCRAGPVVYHRCDPSMRSANAGGKHDAWASGSSLLEPRFSNLDSTLQLTETPCLWQYLTLRVVYYVLHIRAPPGGLYATLSRFGSDISLTNHCSLLTRITV